MLSAGFACTALLWRRSHPRTVVALTGVCALTVANLGYLLTVLLLAPVMVALYTLADRTDRKTARVHVLGLIAIVVPAALVVGPQSRSEYLTVITPIVWLLMPVALGTTTNLRRAYVEAVHARAEYAEQTREEEARHRVAEERLRIARELHDVVAHHLALANAQAGTAAHLVRSRPEQAQQILTELTGTTSAALRELKATVGLLRRPDDPDAPLEPAPGLAQLPDLAASFGPAGLTVTVLTEGDPHPLSAGTDLTAFRIVQEALTNVSKHANSQAALVRLVYSHDRLGITVTDDGAGPSCAAPPPGSGYGLLGMRERAQSVGGRLRTGRRSEGGFEVTAELPLHPVTPEEDTLA